MLSGGFDCTCDLNQSTTFFCLLPPHLRLRIHIPTPTTSTTKQFNLPCTRNTCHKLSTWNDQRPVLGRNVSCNRGQEFSVELEQAISFRILPYLDCRRIAHSGTVGKAKRRHRSYLSPGKSPVQWAVLRYGRLCDA